jgi:hypothetical protein
MAAGFRRRAVLARPSVPARPFSAIWRSWANYFEARKKNQNALNNIMMIAEELGLFIDGDDFNKVGAAIATSELLSVEQFEALFGNPVPHNRAPQMSH